MDWYKTKEVDTVLKNTSVTLAGRHQVCKRIHTPLLFVIADGEASDMLVGRYGNHNLNVQRICRRCNVESLDLSNPEAKFNLFKQKYIYRCVARDDIDELKAISQYAVFNAFMDIWFGVKGVGIIDSNPSDLMHVLRQGLINYCLKIFFNLIPKSMKTNLDGMVREFRDKCRQSILKDFPKFNAYCGVTNVNNMTCDERMGVLFLLTVMLLNEEVWEKLEGREFKDSYVDDKGVTQPVTYTVKGFVYMFEMFLCFRQWSISPHSVWVSGGDQYRRKELEINRKMRAMLQALKDNIPRVDGYHWNIQKFHVLLHLGLDITLFGSPLMFDAARPESHHQPMCKDPAKKCQKTHSNWELKIAKKLKEGRAMRLFRDMIGITERQSVKPLQTVESVKRRSTKYVVYFDLGRNQICSRWDTKSDVTVLGLDNDILRFMVGQYKLNETGQPLRCFTECSINCDRDDTVVVRCHPNYQSKGPWNDWGIIRFQGKRRPAKFHALVDLGDGNIDAIVEVAAGDPTDSGSVLTTSWPFPLSNDTFFGTSYHRVNMRSYIRPSLVFHKNSKEILEVMPFDKWYQKF